METSAVLFLDIDDVLCMQRPYGSFHVGFALRGLLPDPQPVFDRLFTAQSKAALAQVDAAFAGKLRYVISSTWRQSFDRFQMAVIFQEAGLPFVAAGLEQGDGWCTPFLGGGDRAGEIALWLQRHHRGEGYAVVDDSFSGWSLLEAMDRRAPQFVDRVVICEEGVGLLDQHVPDLVAALQRPGVGR